MSNMSEELTGEYVERYVAPWYEISIQDATSIIEQAKASYPIGSVLLEIVFEPYQSTQMFRFIADEGLLDDILEFMIEAIVEAMPQTNPDDREWSFSETAEFYRTQNLLKDDGPARANPDVVRQAALRYLGSDPPFDTTEPSDELDDIRYPPVIRAFPYRAVWKDMYSVDMPEYTHPLTISNLLGEADPWDGGTDSFMRDFGMMTGCEVVNNMSANMLYVGSMSKESLEDALRCMRMILVNKIRANAVELHMLCSEVQKSYFTMTRSNSALRLFRSTLLVDQEILYEDIYDMGEHICLSPDQKIQKYFYPPLKAPVSIEKRPKVDRTPWSVWTGYRYPNKVPGPSVDDFLLLDLDDRTPGAWSSSDPTAPAYSMLIADLGRMLNTSPNSPIIVDETVEPGVLPLFRLIFPRVWPSSLLTKVAAGRKSRDQYIQTLCEAMKHLVQPFMRCNDQVTLKVSFGRILLNETLSIAQRNNATHFNYEEEKLIQGLNTYFPSHGGQSIFTPVVSLFGSDAARMPRFMSEKGKRLWQDEPESRSVWYEFRFADRVRPGFDCIISINAETFAVRYCERQSGDGRIMVHYAQKPWDFVVDAARANAAKVKAAFDADGKVGKCLAQTLTVNYNSRGAIVLSAELPRSTNKVLENIKIRHTAKYRSAINGSAHLVVDMVDMLMIDHRPPRFTAIRPPTGVEKGTPSRWYEASVSSVHADAMFANNAKRRVGDASSWTVKDMESSSVFMNLAQHSINMMPDMAMVGCHNDNGISAAWGLPAEEPEPDLFW